MKYDDVLDELSETALNELRKADWYSGQLKEADLDAAYRNSASEYNNLFDEIERRDREARRQTGTYSIDDYLDDREEERKREASRVR